MSEKTRYSKLLVNIMPEEIREEFFFEGEEDTDAGWDLFEAAYPDKANDLFTFLQPMLEEIEKDMRFQRDYQKLLSEGKELDASRLMIFHRASKIKW